MKIGTFSPDSNGIIEGIRIFRPCQTLLARVINTLGETVPDFANETIKVLATLQNSNNGSQKTLIPYILLNKLAEISTFNEGVVLQKNDSCLYPIMLNPIGNIELDSDKYIDVAFNGVAATETIELYAFEASKISDFVPVYSKMSTSSGVARQKFNVATNDVLCLPITGFDSIQLTYKSGSVGTYTPTELEYLMSKTNDLTMYHRDTNTGGVVTITSAYYNSGSGTVSATSISELIMSYGCQFIVNLLEVDSIELIRDTNCSANYEFILCDFVK